MTFHELQEEILKIVGPYHTGSPDGCPSMCTSCCERRRIRDQIKVLFLDYKNGQPTSRD